LKQDEFEAVLQYLVNRVKELKADTVKLKRELDEKLTEAFEMIKTLSEAEKQVVERQSRLEARLDKLEGK